MTLTRHGRACPGHPRLVSRLGIKGVDARDKRGHDVGIIAAPSGWELAR
jgi:hypothetical protein